MSKNQSNFSSQSIDVSVFDDPQNLISDQDFRVQTKALNRYSDYFLESCTKAKCIQEISRFPDRFIQESVENSFFLGLRNFYAIKAIGLTYYELEHSLEEKRILHSEYFHSPMVLSLREVEHSRAWLRFIEIFFDKCHQLQEHFHRHEAVWLAVEECWCLHRLREANIDPDKFGSPLVNRQGRVLGKKEELSYFDHFITACEETLSTGILKRSPVEFSRSLSPKEDFGNFLLAIAIRQANITNDQHLEIAIKNLLRAIREDNNCVRNDPLCQIVRMHKGRWKITGKGRKSFKPESSKMPKGKGFGGDVRNCNEKPLS